MSQASYPHGHLMEKNLGYDRMDLKNTERKEEKTVYEKCSQLPGQRKVWK